MKRIFEWWFDKRLEWHRKRDMRRLLRIYSDAMD